MIDLDSLTRAERDAYDRGLCDANRGRSPLFHKKKYGIVADFDDSQAEDWDENARLLYLEGYSKGSV